MPCVLAPEILAPIRRNRIFFRTQSRIHFSLATSPLAHKQKSRFKISLSGKQGGRQDDL
jgi:hypothetical protein